MTDLLKLYVMCKKEMYVECERKKEDFNNSSLTHWKDEDPHTETEEDKRTANPRKTRMGE